jgi:hypothetical protein
MDLVRESMSGVREWVSLLPWLSRYDDSSYLDEIRPLGAAGYRSFARLAMVRSDGLIDHVLRRALGEVRKASASDAIDVFLIAGAGGGLGSALLPDVTYLIHRHAPKSSRTACLVLPPAGVSGRARFDANSFATLYEVAALKAMRFKYEVRFETLPPIDVRILQDQAWQRVYLLEAQSREEMPFADASRRLAEILALQLEPNIARIRREISQDYTSVLVAPGPLPGRLEGAFSTFDSLAFEFPQGVAGEHKEDPIKEGMLEKATDAFVVAFDQDLLGLREPVYETRKPDLARIHEELWQREDLIIKAIRLKPPIQPSDSGESVELPKRPFLEVFSDKLRNWPWIREAYLSIQKDRSEPEPKVPQAFKILPVDDARKAKKRKRREIPDGPGHVEDLKILRIMSGTIWPDHEAANDTWRNYQESTEGRKSSEARKIRRYPIFSKLRQNMVWNITERIATLRVLVRTPEFQDSFREAFRTLAHEWLGYDPNIVVPDPSFLTWLGSLEKNILGAERSIFSSSTPQPERRIFALVLLPKVFPPGFDRIKVREGIEHEVEALLNCQPRFIDHPGDKIRIYFEDLFHETRDIKRLSLYRKAYLAEPVKELFHTDYRFITDDLWKAMCEEDEDRSSLVCGNAGCNANFGPLPASVRTCPSCGGPIRSRCGNSGCKVRDLHLRPEANARTCPGCGGLNHAAWWTCCEHGKIITLVPIDKERCPECVQCHHDDPVFFPAGRISVRPDLRSRQDCWHCEELARKDTSHAVFQIPPDLAPFVRDGVNGHDRLKFVELAGKYKLDDNCKCPSCGTLLIPTDHRR